MCFGKRPAEEFFNLSKDPDCVVNLAVNPEQGPAMAKMKEQLFSELKEQGDPRMFGNGAIFDGYPYSGATTDRFYERFTAGEAVKAGWVKPGDFEKEPVE